MFKVKFHLCLYPCHVWGSKWVFILCNNFLNWPELEAISLLKCQSWETNPHPELLALEDPFIYRSSQPSFVMGGPHMFPFAPCGSHFAPFPARPIVLLLAAGPAECPRVKHVPCCVYWMITLKTMHKNLTACQLVPTWKHLILLSDYLILTSLMCRWVAPSKSQSCALAINHRAHFKKF